MARREVVLETRNLAMHFGGVRAVDSVDFELREKSCAALSGQMVRVNPLFLNVLQDN